MFKIVLRFEYSECQDADEIVEEDYELRLSDTPKNNSVANEVVKNVTEVLKDMKINNVFICMNSEYSTI